MKKASIAIVDSAHARLYTYSETEQDGPMLLDEHTLANPERQVRGQFTDGSGEKPGVVGTGGQPRTGHRGGHGSADDHRGGHFDELDARFAKTIIGELASRAKAAGVQHVIVAAAPHMLGVLRGEMGAIAKSGVALTELDQNLAHLTLAQLQEHLSKAGLIGPRLRLPPVRHADQRA